MTTDPFDESLHKTMDACFKIGAQSISPQIPGCNCCGWDDHGYQHEPACSAKFPAPAEESAEVQKCQACDDDTCEVHCPYCFEKLNQDGDCICIDMANARKKMGTWRCGKCDGMDVPKHFRLCPQRKMDDFVEYCVKLPFDNRMPSHIPTGSIRQLAEAYVTLQAEVKELKQQLAACEQAEGQARAASFLSPSQDADDN
jgi:hypothetical protein